MRREEARCRVTARLRFRTNPARAASMNEQPIPLMHSPPGAETVIDGRPLPVLRRHRILGLAGASRGDPRSLRSGPALRRRQRHHPGRLRHHAAAGGSGTAGRGTAGRRVRLPLPHRLRRAIASWPPPWPTPSTLVFLDELSHYCVVEAAQSTGRPVFRFRPLRSGRAADGPSRANSSRPSGRW